MKCFISLFASFHEKIQLLLKVILHLVTISVASGVLFLLGFYVIPAFAESIPHVASQNKVASTSQLASDQDGDGLPDSLERKIGSEVLLRDTDGDGIPDGLEVSPQKEVFDHDKDGRPDILDEDDDGDGIPTIFEGAQDADGDGVANYLDLDSDGDGVLDQEEAGLTLNDTDRDRVDDKFDADFTKGQDDNGDGIDDNIALKDSNNNGIADFLDKKTRVAHTTLMNPKSAPNDKQNKIKLAIKKTRTDTYQASFKDIVTPIRVVEKKVKAEPATVDIKPKSEAVSVVKKINKPVVIPKIKRSKSIQITDDSDGDGLSNAIELAVGMNPMSADSDGDSVPDFIEIGRDNKTPQDSDQDGIPDALDADDDNDGILTKLEDADKNGQVTNDDTDKDGVPNYLDANDDGDSRLTKLEGAEKDSDKDGIPDYLDNSDGVSATKKSKVVILYDENDKSNRSLKEQSVTFDLAKKGAEAEAE